MPFWTPKILKSVPGSGLTDDSPLILNMQSGEREGERQRETASAKDGLIPPSSQSGGTDVFWFFYHSFFLLQIHQMEGTSGLLSQINEGRRGGREKKR